MEISSLDKVLSANGYDFDFVNGIFHVKLGGFANEVSVSWDFSHQRLNYSYRQTITPCLSVFWAAFTVDSIIDGDQIGAVLKAVLTMIFFLTTIITELRVVELRRVLNQDTDSPDT